MLSLTSHFSLSSISPGSAIPMDHPSSSLHFSLLRSRSISIRSRRPNSILNISCHSSRYGFPHSGDHHHDDDDDDDSNQDYFEASFLVTETIHHYRMWKKRFQEDVNFNQRDSRVNSQSLGLGFFRRFRSPTVFLKISCNGDFLLPIVVGEYAIEKLIDSQLGIENGDAPDLFQFIQDLIVKVGYEVTTARITERVVNTYFARLFLRKDGENEMSVDARPSDALNIAYRCKIPVLVSKQIVYEDAIRVSYGFGRVRERKSCFDVLLDSAADGRDFLSEELDMLKNMKMAIYEERYKDAAMWRDKLTKLRKSVREA